MLLLGRFADAGILSEFISILQPDEYLKPMYHKYIEPSYKFNIVKEINSVYYQHFSFAVGGIAKILARHPELREDTVKALEPVFHEKLYVKRMHSGLEGSTYDVIVKNIGILAEAKIFQQQELQAVN